VNEDKFPMMTFPSDKMRSPYSGTEGEFTPRKTEVYCPRCRYQTVTTLTAPKCGNCKSNLIVVPRYKELMT
jgi:hypothetical protein